MAKGEVYRGYRSAPVAMSGAIGIAAAAFQPAGLVVRDPTGFVVYWTAIAAAATLVSPSENPVQLRREGRRASGHARRDASSPSSYQASPVPL